MTTHSPSVVRAWSVTLAALGINLVLGALYAWSVIAKALTVQWGWTKTEAVLPFALSTASFALMMIFAGRMQDRFGPRWVAAAGGVLFGLGLAASAWVRSPAGMALTFGLIGGLGIGLGYSATTPAAIKWFRPQRKGLITGIVVSGVGLAAVYISPLTSWLLGRTTIENTFLVLGGCAMLVVILLALVLRNPPAYYRLTPPAANGAATPRPERAPRRDWDWNEMTRTPQFYLLWLIYVLSAAAGLMVISNIAIIAREQAAWEAGYVGVMTLAAFNTLGRVVAGYVSDRIGRTNTMILAFTLQAVNMFLFARYDSVALLVTGTAVTGLCYGAIFTLMPAATADFYGLKHLGVNYGMLFTGFGVAGVVGSLLGGRVRDLLGSYSVAYTTCGAMLLVAAALAFTTRAPRAATAEPAGVPQAAGSS